MQWLKAKKCMLRPFGGMGMIWGVRAYSELDCGGGLDFKVKQVKVQIEVSGLNDGVPSPVSLQ